MRPNKFLFLAFFVSIIASSCNEKYDDGAKRTIQVYLNQDLSATNDSGDIAFNYLEAERVGYSSNTRDYGTAIMSNNGFENISGQLEVRKDASTLWCYTPSPYGQPKGLSVPASVSKNDPSTSDVINNMVFCTSSISISENTSPSGTIIPLTSGVVLDLIDTGGKWAGKSFSSVILKSEGGIALAGELSVNLQEGKIDDVLNASSSLCVNCSGHTVGTEQSPVSLGMAILPCNFTGTITVTGDGFNQVFTISDPLVFQAGYVKHITLDLDKSTHSPKGFPKRLGIIGDSISTFQGMIPSNHKAYYTNPAGSGCDVLTWQQTYWGLLVDSYWNCELDMNSSWSGSCVADGQDGDARTPYVSRSRLDLFKNPDTIIIFGGTNDCLEKNGIGLGEYSYDVPLSSMNTYKRFRDAYIYVIRYLQEKHPGVQFICIIGTHMTGEYAVSVGNIAKHYGFPCIDFRNDKNVTFWKSSHPNAAGHAYKAKKIYEETLEIFQ